MQESVNPVKEILEQAKGIQGEITALEQERKMIRSMAERSTRMYRSGGRIQGNGVSKIEIGALELQLLDQQLSKKQQEYASTYRKISDCINQLSDPTQRTIMRMRYLYGAPWKDICRQTDYSWGGVHYKHRQALGEIEKWMDTIKH